MKVAVRLFVLLLVAAVVAAPVLLDGCLMNCQTSKTEKSRAQAASEHSCHQAAARPGSRYQLRGDSNPCSHDHSHVGTQVAAATDANPLKLLQAPVAVVTGASILRGIDATFATHPFRFPPGSAIVSPFVAPLRV